jgi:hypothetical protein
LATRPDFFARKQALQLGVWLQQAFQKFHGSLQNKLWFFEKFLKFGRHGFTNHSPIEAKYGAQYISHQNHIVTLVWRTLLQSSH